MPLPASWTLIEVTASYTKRNGDPATGLVAFTSPQIVVIDGQTIVPHAVVGVLDLNGALSVQLPTTDDPDITPGGWTWKVSEHIEGLARDSWSIEVPHDGGPIDLITAAPVAPVDQISGLAALALPNVFTKSQTLASSFAGGEDTSDSTSRLNLESYQSSPINAFGEVIRTFLRKAKAKAMQAWYFPDGGYDGNGDPVGTFRPVVWAGAHWRSGDGASLHKHWSVETPDSTGALQTRFEVRFGNTAIDNAIAGLDKTLILTNQADFVVRCSAGQVLRLSTVVANEKAMEFANDSEGLVKQWKLRSTAAAGDFQFVRYDDAGAFVDALVTMKRGSGRVGIGTVDPSSTFDVNGDKIRVRTALTPASATAFGNQGDIAWDANFLYVCVATSTWKRAAIGTW